MMIAHAYRITASEIVFKGPCLLAGVILTANGNDLDIIFYDGLNNLGRLFLTAWVKDESMKVIPFPGLTDMDKGVYVSINDTGGSVTLFIIPENPKYAV